MANEQLDEKAIFNIARQIASPGARREYLDQVCSGDKSLHERVQALLQGYEEQTSFLESAPVAKLSPTVDQPITENPGSQIGPYKLLQEIGQGGMGVVYMAEQLEPVRRKVALKIIKPGMDTRQVIARFEAERQALSLMDHPNIARVLDAGTTDTGRPYFVMELVKGQPITEYCDQQRLTPPQRLELFLAVCHAIQHAHQKGIIHRDVKPSNVLVAEYDGRPVAKVIDFGVAKAISQPLTEKTMFTGYGQIVGTLEYMSPEQARVNQLDIDTRSDIYSLGVLLYELLTGSTPFDKQRLRSAAWDEMLRIIREEEPPKPSTRISESKDALPSVSAQRQTEPAKLTKLVRGELDWIVMKALEKDRARRYETANGLANDIQRYLNDEPIAACPPSAAYRFRKFARRNKAAMATTGLVAAALVLGLAGTTWQAIRAMVAERQARTSAEAEIQQRQLAEAAAQAERLAKEAETVQRQLAESAAHAERLAKEAEARQREQAQAAENKATEEAAVAKAVNDFLQHDLLGLASAERQLAAEMLPDPNLKLATLLERALAKVGERFADQPRVRAEVQATLAIAFQSIGRYEEATRLQEEVREYRESTLGPEHLDTLQSMNNQVVLYLAQARYAEAEPLCTQCLEIRRRVLGPEHPDTLTSMNNLAMLYQAQARYAEAEPLCTQCLEIRRRVLGPEHPDTLTSMNSLATLYKAQARHAEAEPLYTQCLDVRRRVRGPEHPETLTAMNNLAILYQAQARHPEAESLLTKCLEIRRRVRGPEHPDTLGSMNNLATLYHAQSRHAEAEPLYTQCLEVRRRVQGPEHPDTLTAMLNLAILYHAQTRHAKSFALHFQIMEIKHKLCEKEYSRMKDSLGADHPNTLSSLSNLAASSSAVYRTQEANAIYEEVVKRRTAVLGIAHPDTTLAMNDLAAIWILEGRIDDALAMLKDVLATREARVAKEPVNARERMALAWTHGLIGDAEQIRQQYEVAERAYAAADELSTKLKEERVPFDWTFSDRFAKYQRALAFCRQAQQRTQKDQGAADRRTEVTPRLLPARLKYLLKVRDLRAAIAVAEQMKEGARGDADLYFSACAFSLCAAASQDTNTEARPSDALADEAMKLLNQAVAKGFWNAERIARNPDLTALHDRDDFQSLLRELSASKRENQ